MYSAVNLRRLAFAVTSVWERETWGSWFENSQELDGSPSTLNFGGGVVSSTLAERVVHGGRLPPRGQFLFHHPASTEPPLFTAEDAPSAQTAPPPPIRFNGAAVVHGGRPSSSRGNSTSIRCCFNGAAVVHGGRRLDELGRLGLDSVASTEPPLFTAEDSPIGTRPAGMSTMLQRSRRCSRRKTRWPPRPRLRPGGCFNGAAVVHGGRLSARCHRRLSGGDASTEPPLFTAEDLRRSVWRTYRAGLLQRSRRCSRRKTCNRPRARSSGQRSFNGAAVVHGGRRRSLTPSC